LSFIKSTKIKHFLIIYNKLTTPINEFVLENTISTPDDFSLRRKDYISEMGFTDESLHVFVVVTVLITTGVTSRGEKGLRIRRRSSLRF
jgi:hypothetical protein